MAYLDQWKLLHNEDFCGRVAIAALKAAADILTEDDTPANESPRKVLALQVQNLNPPALQSFVLECTMNTTVAGAEAATPGSSKDGDLDYIVASKWNHIAGV